MQTTDPNTSTPPRLFPADADNAATLSPCGRYRWTLTRTWSDELPRLGVVMLNPSTADAERDDPTARKVCGFARREGFGGVMVGNLFAYRATDPMELHQLAAASMPRAIGPGNDSALCEIARTCATILTAWGANARHYPRRVADVLDILTTHGARIVCLGVTDGKADAGGNQPRHPLYIPNHVHLTPYHRQERR
jgi:hypothetical protein